MAKYFITGGAGFIGSNLLKRLLLDHDSTVTIYDNFSNGRREFINIPMKESRFSVEEGDTLNIEALKVAIKGHDTVIHLAANANIALSATQTDLDLKQTVMATYNVLEAMRESNVSNLIFTSGSGVYGDIPNVATPEDYGPMKPISMYGATKLAAEALVSAYGHLYGIKAHIFRFANVVGPNQTHGVAYDFIGRLRKTPDRLDVLGDGNQSKSYIHVEDVIDAIACVQQIKRDDSTIHNVSSGDHITVKEIAQIVLEEMGLKSTKVSYGITPYGWMGDVPIVRLDDNLIKSIGWRPKYNSKQAIRQSVRQMLTEN